MNKLNVKKLKDKDKINKKIVAVYTGSMTSWAIDQILEIDQNYNFNTLFTQGGI